MTSAVYLIFGATGDLARRKLFPAFYSLYRERKLGDRFAVIGLARRPRTNEQFRDDLHQSIEEFARYKVTKDEQWDSFAEHFQYMSLDINNVDGFKQLRELTDTLDAKFDVGGNRLYYLALAPELFGSVSHNLKEGGLLESAGWNRLVIEKPFGYDLQSAEKLNAEIRQVFEEQDIYRIDHYLGKEMVQNINVVRFANAFFEPLWNNKYIANIQITLSETVGVEERGGYYDHSGALRDMGQNHMLQMLAIMAMEPPSRMHPEDIRDEKVKVFRSLRGFQTGAEVRANTVRGQYAGGTVKGQQVRAYRDEDSVNPESTTETYFAARVFVDNFRWAGVPFYIRTGKRLPVKTTEVVVEFKNVPDNVYLSRKHKLEPNLLVFRVNPMEGIYFKMNAKQPGSEGTVVPVAMDFCQSCQVGLNTPEAYERLIYDAARGDSTYFTRWDEVALAWKYVDKIAAEWGADGLQLYGAGTWGPEKAQQLLAEDGFRWWPVNGQDEGEVAWETGRTLT
ncbi:glucose-6-phosphate dehydrogenase [Paenibacillus mucilaginosus]|uniref:Glucose-6-phosphate 1-dehydrogenase n=2 Tax=Paenibacillus mucilaginosus TaxID=61624 RepID=H6NBV5_9BACL|nr:glucose-6-phosphate dehydrogenase [Paenibacillus mucilaginosus]AEI42095.1 glucose-6-phosphate 1-dehydrogenase [Paenibacillus mucilaginosus KNP414]AFC27906.1 glucose-6-phosphate 1-dehydrogenase [Paenibacillus mucilaginosus 3016]MCG7214080.1 glucose-6-phosphate dehydrogenase [Paenibacillus mucilaginosus]WDM28603.1 glucose-6-phosphate dehydrogenase [Paenibacillus mucilaginosus]WFA16769.1 glucose-6-phosphate dehydrogenase [Paenibacillus mucilaginosus]